MSKKWYYGRIKFKNKYKNRKIWYINNGYLCDCINLPFKNKQECIEAIKDAETRKTKGIYPYCTIEKITIHYTR